MLADSTDNRLAMLLTFDLNRDISMDKFNKVLLAISLLALSGAASAVPITGSIKFGGDLTFDFAANTVDIIGDDALVVGTPTDDFSGIAEGTVAVYNDFTYDPFSTVDPLWSVGGFSFTLTDLIYVEEKTILGVQFLTLAGGGTFSGNGFDDTSGGWTFSADGTSAQFAFSTTNVPEPGIAMLLGVGLIGFGISRKLRKTA